MKIKSSLRIYKICVWILGGVLLFQSAAGAVPQKTKAIKNVNSGLPNSSMGSDKLYQAAYMEEEMEGDESLEWYPMEITEDKPYAIIWPGDAGEETGNYLLRITGTSEQEIDTELVYQFQQKMKDNPYEVHEWTTQYTYQVDQWISDKGRTYSSLFPYDLYDECCEWRVYFDQETVQKMTEAGLKLRYSLEKTTEWGNYRGILWHYEEGYPTWEYLKPIRQYARVYDYAESPDGNWEISVPEQLGGYPVEVIGRLAFYRINDVIKITLPEGLLSLEEQALSFLPNIQELELPSTLRMVSGGSFYRLGDRLRVRISEKSPYYEIVDECLIQKRNGELAAYLNEGVRYCILPDEVKYISPGAFCENYLISLTVPAGVQSIWNMSVAAWPELKKLVLYNSDCEINGPEISKLCKEVVVYSYSGGEVQKQCEENGIAFQELDPVPTEAPTRTQTPAGSPAPTGVLSPTPTRTPDKAANTSEPTKQPDITSAPEMTETPMPAKSSNPVPTLTPTQTQTPAGSPVPTGVPSPIPTRTPDKAVNTSEPTKQPDITNAPEMTKTPVPAKSSGPVQTETPAEDIGASVITAKPAALSMQIEQKSGRVTIRWKKVSGAAGYKVYRSTQSKSKGFRLQKGLQANENAYVDRNVQKGKKYYYKVSAQIRQKDFAVREVYSKAGEIQIKQGDIPSFSVTKRRAGNIPYLRIKVQGRKKENAQIYVAVDGGKYKKIVLSNSSIRERNGVFRIRYREGYRYFQIRIRTYKIVSGKKVYSDFSDSVTVRL